MQRHNGAWFMSGVDPEGQKQRREKVRGRPPRGENYRELSPIQKREQHRLRMLARSRRGKHVRRINLEFWASLTPEQRKAEVKRRFKKS
jgi:hypothetical protein